MYADDYAKYPLLYYFPPREDRSANPIPINFTWAQVLEPYGPRVIRYKHDWALKDKSLEGTYFAGLTFGCPERDIRGVKGAYGYNPSGVEGLDSGANMDYRGFLGTWGMGTVGELNHPETWHFTTPGMILKPSDMISAGDISSRGWSTYQANHALDLYQLMRKRVNTFQGTEPGGHHMGGANMLFVDGHVEWAKQSKWLSDDDEVIRRFNNDNEVHRELLAR